MRVGQGLVEVVGGEHAEHDGDPGVECDPGDAGRALPRDVFEVRRLAADDDAETGDAGEVAAIAFDERPNQPDGVLVTLALERRYRLRQGTIPRLTRSLIGDVALDMLPGTKVYKLPDDMSLRLLVIGVTLLTASLAVGAAYWLRDLQSVNLTKLLLTVAFLGMFAVITPALITGATRSAIGGGV